MPESSLEALTMAMRSDFVQTGDSRRHIIALFTDDGAHPLEDYDKLVEEAAKESCRPTMYPDNMPKDIEEFYRMWQKKMKKPKKHWECLILIRKGEDWYYLHLTHIRGMIWKLIWNMCLENQ